MIGETSVVLNDITDNYKYKIVIKNSIYPALIIEKTYAPVIINDLEANWNYYQGLNYVYADDGVLPTGVNQELYDETNLVCVDLSYSSAQIARRYSL